MLNVLSLLVGLIALIFAVPAFLPLLGWAAGYSRKRR